MEVVVKAKFLKISPKKVNPLLKLIRGKKVKEALAILLNINKKSSSHLTKLINSGIAVSKNNFNLDENNLHIAQIKADKGPFLRRTSIRARGGLDIVRKPTCHLVLVLSEEKEEKTKKKETKKEVKKIERKKEIKKEEKIQEEEKIEKEKTRFKKESLGREILKHKLPLPKSIFRRKGE